MKKPLIVAAAAEAATGLALLIVPSLVGQLLLGETLTGVAIPVARVAGVALIGLGIACWPGPPLIGMLTYSATVTLYGVCPRPGRRMITKFAASRRSTIRSATIDAITSAACVFAKRLSCVSANDTVARRCWRSTERSCSGASLGSSDIFSSYRSKENRARTMRVLDGDGREVHSAVTGRPGGPFVLARCPAPSETVRVQSMRLNVRRASRLSQIIK
jgi:hypothetical protein